MTEIVCGSQNLKYLRSSLLQEKFANPWSKGPLPHECPDSNRLKVPPDFPDSHPASRLIIYPVVCLFLFVHPSVLSICPSIHQSSCYPTIHRQQPPIHSVSIYPSNLCPCHHCCPSVLCVRHLECKCNYNTIPPPGVHGLSVAVSKEYQFPEISIGLMCLKGFDVFK